MKQSQRGREALDGRGAHHRQGKEPAGVFLGAKDVVAELGTTPSAVILHLVDVDHLQRATEMVTATSWARLPGRS